MTDLEALDHFVCENDELIELEQRIGRFSIFDALGIVEVEIRHSNFLAWLLNPSESHGQGSIFLKSVLMDLLRQMDLKSRPLSPVELEAEQLLNVDIRREWQRIDMLITCSSPEFVIAVENKIRSGEHSNQLDRYQETVREAFRGCEPMLVFLTPDGTEPSLSNWVPYTYRDLYRVLRRTVEQYATAMNDDVRAFIEHYLRLIGSRLMNDPKIEELCRMIYRNHRQAIDLIVEHGQDRPGDVLPAVAEWVKENSDRFHFGAQSKKEVSFVPRPWMAAVPAIASATGNPEMWPPETLVCIILRNEGERCRLSVLVREATDADLRQRTVERLTEESNPFRFKRSFKVIPKKSTTIHKHEIANYGSATFDHEQAVAQVKHVVEKLQKRTAAMAEHLADLRAEAQQQRTASV